MNYIKQLQADKQQLESRILNTDKAINHLLAFIVSPKFVGIEADGTSKGWISTGDLHHLLIDIRNTL